MNWKVGDWAVFERDIIQIVEIYEDGGAQVSEGSFVTSGGRILERLRPLTLQNKRVIEYFDYLYRQLNLIRGERGFNYPDISRYFSNLALQAIDGSESDKEPFDKGHEFIKQAKLYTPIIDGVHLFREH